MAHEDFLCGIEYKKRLYFLEPLVCKSCRAV